MTGRAQKSSSSGLRYRLITCRDWKTFLSAVWANHRGRRLSLLLIEVLYSKIKPAEAGSALSPTPLSAWEWYSKSFLDRLLESASL